jgi:3-carboxy-cis,cis-muconate cycloisomerase
VTFATLDSAITGDLFSTPAMRAVFSDHARIAAMLQVETALARAQAECGLIPPNLHEALAALGPDDLDIAALGPATATAGVPVIPFVKAVQKRLPPDCEALFHKGATTQDILDTALVLQIRDAFELLETDLQAILIGLRRLASAYRASPCVGRTYGQHAAPVTFGFKAAVWLAGIADAARVLRHSRQGALMASLGGPVGTLAGLGQKGPEVADAFARHLGLAAPPIAWHTRRGGLVAAGAEIAILIGALAKMAGDVAHLCTTEVAEVAEPFEAGRGGSSAMPHKRNPVSCTVIVAAHLAAASQVGLLFHSMAAQHERPVGAWHAEWSVLPVLFGLAAGALREARHLAEGLEVDEERMRANLNATRGLLFADAAASRLSGKIGRQAAHELVERAADDVRRTGRELPTVLAGLTSEDVASAFDLDPAIEAAQPWIDRALAEADQVIHDPENGK